MSSTTPPPEEPTMPMLPEAADVPPIPTRKARLMIAGAFLDVLAAVARAQGVCDAVGRQLDGAS